ncbi:hypothetical protein [Motilimonas sp. E26]|uniref:hypothetical protein n=1 Tax=Motilimonas sp. E26 TaxID=2865674 RepID=UPI001E4B5862|nr:hypothetical protein [Motilimonas sp. E26]MCE0557406.1 hypothetical protein [Motilimonas sp. E26]
MNEKKCSVRKNGKEGILQTYPIPENEVPNSPRQFLAPFVKYSAELLRAEGKINDTEFEAVLAGDVRTVFALGCDLDLAVCEYARQFIMMVKDLDDMGLLDSPRIEIYKLVRLVTLAFNFGAVRFEEEIAKGAANKSGTDEGNRKKTELSDKVKARVMVIALCEHEKNPRLNKAQLADKVTQIINEEFIGERGKAYRRSYIETRFNMNEVKENAGLKKLAKKSG